MIHGHARHSADVITHHEQVERRLLTVDLVHAQVAQVDLLIHVFVESDLVPFIQRQL